MSLLNHYCHRGRAFWSWIKLLWQRVDEDGMTILVGHLAYVSLLSLVPLIAVIFVLFVSVTSRPY